MNIQFQKRVVESGNYASPAPAIGTPQQTSPASASKIEGIPSRHQTPTDGGRSILDTLNRILWSLLRGIYSILPIQLLRVSVEASRNTPRLVRNLVHSGDTSLVHLVSRRFALDSFRRAARRVPAYRRFLAENGVNPDRVRSLDDFNRLVPRTDRDNYIKAFPIRERCVDGCLPAAGAVDESAGSSGEPLNWVRSAREIALLEGILAAGVNLFLGAEDRRKPTLLINAFSCGAWAAGFRFGSALEGWGLVKNTGPDMERIHKTLAFFGAQEHYVIAGYPPFLLELVRYLRAQPSFDLKAYTVDLMTGGEGFPEGWRRFMEGELADGARILSGYGASDLEVGIATETPYSVALLKLIEQDAALRGEVFGTERNPIFFGQYNPTSHYIRPVQSSQGRWELEVTVLNGHSVSPKIKYRVGDEGNLISFERMQDILRARAVHCPVSPVALPFLHIMGRLDGTVSIDGANVYPATIHAALMEHPVAAREIATFKMGVTQVGHGSARLAILLQAVRGSEPSETLTRTCKQVILQRLLMENPDFRQSFKDNPISADPLVEIVPFHSERFSDHANRIKHSYLMEPK